MRSIKRITAVIVFSLLILNGSVQHTFAYQIISETSEKQMISSGVTLEQITRFTTDGWMAINITRVDLSNPDIKAKALSSQTSLKNLESLTKMASAEKAVAAVNGSFFVWWKEAGLATPIGITVEEGKLESSVLDWNFPNNVMANLNINKDGTSDISYFKMTGNIFAPSGQVWKIGHINKPFSDKYGDLTIQTRAWSKTSEKVYSTVKDFVELVVENDMVKEIRQSMPETEIPENGYVISGCGKAGKFLVENFLAGDPVQMQLSSEPDFSLIQESITGGSQLIQDGKIVDKFSWVEEGRNPQTAVGITKDKKNLILVTVDGRQKKSIGMSLKELASYMAGLGAYNALAFDSGGSTTMVARLPGREGLQTMNSPSDGSQRRIVNGLGIVNTAPTGKLSGILLIPEEENVFVNSSRSFRVIGHDKNYNPVPVNPNDIKWAVSGVKGTFTKGVFNAKTIGTARVSAKLGTISGSANVYVLSVPASLSVSEKEIEMMKGESKRISVIGYNKNGYSATIAPADLKWSFGGVTGEISDGAISCSKSGYGYVKVSMGKTVAYTHLHILTEKRIYFDPFEEERASFTGYPSSVTGTYSVTGETFAEGKASGKLTFDFSENIDQDRAAYLVFQEEGILLPKETAKIAMKIKTDTPSSCSLKTELIDSEGKKHLVVLQRGFEDTEWSDVTVPLAGISLPAKLTKLYVLQENPVPVQGSIYVDSLSVSSVTQGPAANSYAALKDTVPVDLDRKKITVKSSASSFGFTIFPQLSQPNDKKEESLVRKVYAAMQKESEFAAFPGGSLLLDNKKKTPSFNFKGQLNGKGIKSILYKNCLIIQLDINKNESLRLTDKSSWSWLLDTLKGYKGKNIFIVSDQNPYDFSDRMEGKLLRDTLTKYALKGDKVYFAYPGESNASFMDSGVKYLPVEGVGEKTYSTLRIAVSKGKPYYWYDIKKR